MPLPTYQSIEDFRTAAKEGPVEAASVRASLDTEVKMIDDERRSVGFTISTGQVDRMGDVIDPMGWQLDEFRKNPVVLWGHDSGALPVGRATRVWIEDGKLKAEAQFTPAGMARFNDTVYEMVKAGFLNATSVGFRPLKYALSEDPQRRYGIDFKEQELLEFSVVSVPANPGALIDARSAGIDISPMIDHFREMIARCGLEVVELEWAERMRRAERERVAKEQRLAASARRSRELELMRLRSL